MRKYSQFACLCFAMIAWSACKKSNSTSKPEPATINNVSPLEGPGATKVTITGRGFSVSPQLDTVYFNGKLAAVDSASDTLLVAEVPLRAGTGNISVVVKGSTANGPVFTYDYKYFVSHLAGGAANPTNGTGLNAGFGVLNGITNDGNGNLYLGDLSVGQVKKVTTEAGVVTTFAGTGLVTVDADGPLSTAAFAGPADVIVKGSTVYVLDAGSGSNGASVRMISGTAVTTIAGGGAPGSANGTGTAAHFGNCWGFDMDAAGNFYVADANYNTIRKVTPAGVVTTFAGSGASGSLDATGTNASFSGPVAIAVDAAGNLFVADQYNHKIREITPAGVVTTFAGSGNPASVDGTGTAASFNLPNGLAFDSSGNLYVADMGNNQIRKITKAGVVTTFAGTGAIGQDDGPANIARFAYPAGVTVDQYGFVYVADGSDVVRQISVQ